MRGHWYCRLTLLMVILVNFGMARGNELDPEWYRVRVDSLRAAGDLDHALEVAHEWWDETRTRPGLPTFETGDARRAVEALHHIRGLDDDAKREIATADSLGLAVFEHYYADEIKAAATAARRQLDIRRRRLGDHHKETADAALYYGLVLEELDQFAASGELYEFAWIAYERSVEPVHPGKEALLNNISFLLEKEGRFRENVSVLRQSLVQAIEIYGADSEEVATSLNNLGSQLQNVGEYAESDRRLRAALTIQRDCENWHEVARTLLNLGVSSYEQGQFDVADGYFARARSVVDSTGIRNDELLASLTMNEGTCTFAQGAPERAADLYNRALEIKRRFLPEESVAIASARMILGNCLCRLRDFAGAARQQDPAADILLRLQGAVNPDRFWALGCQADRFRLQGKYRDASLHLKEACDVYERCRRETGGVGLSEIYRCPWPDYAASLLQTGQPQEAWVALEMGQGRLVADALARAVSSPRPAAQHGEIVDRWRDVKEARAALLALTDSGSGDRTTSFAQAWESLARAEAALEAARSRSRAAEAATERALPDLTELQASIRRDEAVIGWLMQDEEFPTATAWGYVIRSTGPVTWIVDLPLRQDPDSPSPTRRAISRMARRQNSVDDAEIAWRQRILPLLEHLDGIDRVVVVPAGDMHGVPVEALGPEGGPTFGDHFLVSYAPSTTIFTEMRKRDRNSESRGERPVVLAFGDPIHRDPGSGGSKRPARPTSPGVVRGVTTRGRDALGSLPPLTGSRDEVAHLQAFGAPGSQVFLGERCSEVRLLELVRDDRLVEFDVVHFATHALVDARDPRHSFLVLNQIGLPEPGSQNDDKFVFYDGLVTAEEVKEEWRLEADLVTLSGCATALGRRVKGEGFLGFTNVFLERGARALVASLWPVDDRATALLMQRFYDGYLGADGPRLSKVEALAAAKRYVRDYEDPDLGSRPYGHPFHWASFVLVGCPD